MIVLDVHLSSYTCQMSETLPEYVWTVTVLGENSESVWEVMRTPHNIYKAQELQYQRYIM